MASFSQVPPPFLLPQPSAKLKLKAALAKCSPFHNYHLCIITAFAIVGSVLHGVIYLVLLVAIFAGRSKPDAAIPPALKGA
jgi:hypothetical protein